MLMDQRSCFFHLLVCIVLVQLILQLVSAWPVGRTTRFYDFKVETKAITKLCKTSSIVTINGMYPGPIVYAQEDDRVIVKVTNLTPYNMTIHWHGVRQRLTCWFDGPAYITQCPIQAGQSFTYEFTLVKQKGTLFWHAHVSWLRATVHGPIVIYPKTGVPYPFQFPSEEHVLILGEYWVQDVQAIENLIKQTGGGPPVADAYVINGHPGPLYNCSQHDVYNIQIIPGKTYLLRIINAALNMEHFFTIANHKLTVVELDAEYSKPFTTDHLMMTPGQTTNVLVTADQPIGSYYMGMGPYMSGQNIPFQQTPALALFNYHGSSNNLMHKPKFPKSNDSQLVRSFMEGLKSLADEENPAYVPQTIDRNLFFTIGLNVEKCKSSSPQKHCQAPNGGVFAASMNNFTFVRPPFSLLQAYFNRLRGYFTEDFPDSPLRVYDFVNGAPNNFTNNTQSLSGTKLSVLEYGSNVQLVLQDTGTAGTENHPIHLHGFNFYVVGFGFGNYNPKTAHLNLVDPPYRNTIGVPVGGWAAVRFTADNPEHKMTVVEVDGEYTKPFTTNYLMLTPGQTFNVLVTADQPVGKYYMAMGPYMSAEKIPFQKSHAYAHFNYEGCSPFQTSIAAKLPNFNDSQTSQSFMAGLRSLADKQHPINVPHTSDRNLFFTVGLNVLRCNSSPQNCQAPNGGVFAASMNNITFVRPTVSLLQAYHSNLSGYYTTDFPDKPPKFFDFVNGAPNNLTVDTQSMFGTRLSVLDYGSNVQIILQDTGTAGTENHPIHLHGFSFYVVGYGFGDYDPKTAHFNLEDPPYRNTIGVPVGGWAAIRFTADNPGVWFMHCHLELHTTWGLSMAFIVKNGKGAMETLPHPPSDLPYFREKKRLASEMDY